MAACRETDLAEQSNPPGIEAQSSNKSYFVVGDSLCADEDSWPEILTEKDYVVEKLCIPGRGVIESHLSYETVDIDEVHRRKGNSRLLIAIGVNDAIKGSDPDEFISKYSLMVDSSTLCLLPPLSQHPEIQTRVDALREKIISTCTTVIYPAESDHEDGLHYTINAQQLNAEIVAPYLTSAT